MSNSVERAIILSAGKGSRLLPLTAEKPKCTIELAGRTLLEWQLGSLIAAGIREIFVVTGFRSDLVEAVIASRAHAPVQVSTIFNPFYHVAENLGSAWMAREVMDRDFLLLNGDTLVAPSLVERLIAAPTAPICLAVDCKATYDDDDMKVLREGARLVRVGKALEQDNFNAEAIGLARFQAGGRDAFRNAVDRLLRTSEGTAQFYLRAIDRLADTGIVAVEFITGLDWAEVDYPSDIEAALALAERWSAGELPRAGPARAKPVP